MTRRNNLMVELCKYMFHAVVFAITYVQFRAKVFSDASRLSDFFEGTYKTLILTHNLKGGTDIYLSSLNENDVILLKNIEYVWHLCYRIVVKNKSFYVSDRMMKKILSLKYEKILINSFVKMEQVNELVALLKKNKKIYPNTRFSYFVHDYHSICPNFNLVFNQRFCQFKCEGCNYKKPVVYGSRKFVNINEWRNKWMELFDICEEVRCFSNSSKNIMTTIYPSIASKITVVPHNVAKINGEYKIRNNDGLVVCFCGIINNDAKGLVQTRQLTKKLMAFCKIVFIGSVEREIGIQNKNVTYVGRYKHDDLVSIMNNYCVNIAIFPSICPETFSFMMSELIQTGIKVLSFDIGAQGEKARDYNNGKVFKSCEEMIVYVKSLCVNYDGDE